MSRYLIFLVICLLASCVKETAEIEVWPAPAEAKITRFDTEYRKKSHIWNESEGVVRLAAAGGEHAFFQVVVAVDGKDLHGLAVQAGAFTAEGSRLPVEQVRVYICPLVKVYAPSTEHGKAGWYPDPLVIFSNPIDIIPNRWERHHNQTFWIEFEVPRGQKAGIYQGEVTVRAADRKLASFPVELEVRNFDLPEIFHQYAMFNCSRGWLRSYYNDRVLDGRELDDVLGVYFDFLLERGIQPWFNPLIQPSWEEKDDGLVLSWPNDKWEQHFLSHPVYRRVTFPAVPHALESRAGHGEIPPDIKAKVRDWIKGITDHYAKKGWEDKLTFFGPVDEPNSLEEYEETLRWGELVKSIGEGISFQVTEQPLPSKPDWPSLAAVTTDWVVHGKSLEGNRAELLRQLEAGNHAFWYISCDQTWPMANYFIDEPGIDARAVPWITYNYRLEGMLYWAVNFWIEVKSPWRDPVTWKRSQCNAPLAGEGSLLYPGEEIESYCGQENVQGPVSSIRLEMLRKGMEDVEYIYMLADRGMEAEAMRLCMELVKSADKFSRDPAKYEKVKQEAARLLAGNK